MSIAIDKLPDDPAELKAYFAKELARKDKALDDLRQQLNTLIEALQLERQRHYGAGSEKSSTQQSLFDEAEQDTTEPAQDSTPRTEPRPVRKVSTSKPLPPDLPRIEHIHELPEHERVCACGCQLSDIGEDISEQSRPLLQNKYNDRSAGSRPSCVETMVARPSICLRISTGCRYI